MTEQDIDEQDVWEALQALLVVTDLGKNVYDYGEVPGESGNPGDLPDTYVVLSVERRYVPPSSSGGTNVTGWRASARYVDTNPVNARRAGALVRRGFEISRGRGRSITVAGITSTPIAHESTRSVGPDSGRYSGLSQWTLAL